MADWYSTGSLVYSFDATHTLSVSRTFCRLDEMAKLSSLLYVLVELPPNVELAAILILSQGILGRVEERSPCVA